MTVSLVSGGLYAAYAAALILLQGQFIYPFSDRTFSSADYTRQEVPSDAGAPLPVYVAQGGPEAPVVVYFMGNVGALDLFLAMLDHHRAAGRSVVAMTYRGGGGTPGTPSETQLKTDALAVVDALPDLVGNETGPVVLHGFSLGTGLAVHVAARREVQGVLLSAPYARLCELMAAAAKLPACVLPGVQGWKSVDDVAQVAAPVLILHGAEDSLIPPDHSARLAQAMAGAGVTVTREVIPGGAHNDLMGKPPYLDLLDAFIAALPPK